MFTTSHATPGDARLEQRDEPGEVGVLLAHAPAEHHGVAEAHDPHRGPRARGGTSRPAEAVGVRPQRGAEEAHVEARARARRRSGGRGSAARRRRAGPRPPGGDRPRPRRGRAPAGAASGPARAGARPRERRGPSEGGDRGEGERGREAAARVGEVEGMERPAFARLDAGRHSIAPGFGDGGRTAREAGAKGDRRMGERAEIGIIGGTGLYQMDGLHRRPRGRPSTTPFGAAVGRALGRHARGPPGGLPAAPRPRAPHPAPRAELPGERLRDEDARRASGSSPSPRSARSRSSTRRSTWSCPTSSSTARASASRRSSAAASWPTSPSPTPSAATCRR